MKRHFKYRYRFQSSAVLMVSAALLSVALAGSALAASDPVSIEITGTLLNNTCTIDETNSDLSPSMGELSVRDLKGKGATLGNRDIKIALKDCGKDITRGIDVSAKGTNDDAQDNGTGFKNATTVEAGGASGVALQFYETDKSTPFTTDGNTKETISSGLNDGTNTLTFAAAYISTTDEPAAGAFSTTVELTLAYK